MRGVCMHACMHGVCAVAALSRVKVIQVGLSKCMCLSAVLVCACNAWKCMFRVGVMSLSAGLSLARTDVACCLDGTDANAVQVHSQLQAMCGCVCHTLGAAHSPFATFVLLRATTHLQLMWMRARSLQRRLPSPSCA